MSGRHPRGKRTGLPTFGGRAEKWRLQTSGRRRKSGKATSPPRSQTSMGAGSSDENFFKGFIAKRYFAWAASDPAGPLYVPSAKGSRAPKQD